VTIADKSAPQRVKQGAVRARIPVEKLVWDPDVSARVCVWAVCAVCVVC
jgi:hypothetical protein